MFTIESVGNRFDEFFEVLINFMSEWGGYDEFIEPVENFRKCYKEKIGKIHSPSSGARAINVLSHGDFHPKNVLYKIGDNEVNVEDFVMVRNYY